MQGEGERAGWRERVGDRTLWRNRLGEGEGYGREVCRGWRVHGGERL